LFYLWINARRLNKRESVRRSRRIAPESGSLARALATGKDIAVRKRALFASRGSPVATWPG